ncbi:MAG: hypothetical protein LC130_37225 [Bryobacterales bacterium]|nr:hypothetical protein [Bryobacterales bacterium]
MSSVLREPLPPENLSCTVQGDKIVMRGPTYEYAVDTRTGAIGALQVWRDGQVVVRLPEPANIIIGDYRLTGEQNVGETTIAAQSSEQIVLRTKGILKSAAGGDDLPYSLASTFFNDGVVVSEMTVLPQDDLAVKEIRHEVVATGAFSQYLHKTRDSHGFGAPWGNLPEPGEAVRFSTLTSCLQVFSPKAALAIFTDRGATYAGAGCETAAIEVKAGESGLTAISLVQHIVNESPSGDGLVLEANSPFTFRVGLSLAPNRPAHRRSHDLRMFAWIGDDKHPYPTDEEILDAAQLGHTLFQMHRLGTPGEPRPPAGELDRVIETVHRAGMLFIWTQNADLMFANAPGVQEMKAHGKWHLWQGFNYGGRYTDTMDRYCDLMATCLASPNGLADYRLACDARMMERYAVDGMYIDDNLAYANCPLWKEHGHPEKVYDCLIELHEMNWRRRQLLRARCPHAVLIDHCTTALVLPVICDFDVHLYGEGYGFAPLETHWAQFSLIRALDAQGCHWAGGKESERCVTELAYNYDLLTGGGQYCYSDWRLYPEKFPYASGVAKEEPMFVRAYTLAQSYFGMYEARPYYFAESDSLFATSAPLTYATIYRNEVWKDHLLVLANMSDESRETSLAIRSPERLGIGPDGEYVLWEVNDRKGQVIEGSELLEQGTGVFAVPGRGMKLFYLRELPKDHPWHLWGGKRIAEKWDDRSRTLTVELHGPLGLEDTILVGAGTNGIGEVRVNGKQTTFFYDSSQRAAHGEVVFGADPLRIEVRCSNADEAQLPEKPIAPVDLPGR